MEGTWDTENTPPAPDLTGTLEALYEPAELDRLAMALGGGTFPGLGNGQNDTMPNQDSVAPGFPLNLFFVVPKNQVKQRSVKLSFQPGAFRTYFTAGAAHSHAGDTIQTLSVSIGNEVQNHKHKMMIWQANPGSDGGTQWQKFFWQDITGGLNHESFIWLHTDGVLSADMWTDIDGSGGGGGDHQHSNVAHTHSPGTTGTSNAGGSGGVSESTNPDAMGVLVDGVNVTTALGGPFSSAQADVDITPYVAPGSGIHTVQITTATQLGRISGWVRNSSIVNPLINV